jgi:hypothetical protein
MNGGSTVTSFRSILDKPLNQLTEDDISQLTREDCRRFLKDKGPLLSLSQPKFIKLLFSSDFILHDFRYLRTPPFNFSTQCFFLSIFNLFN